MADIKQSLATKADLTLTTASLASSAVAGREATAIDNSSNLYLDALVQGKVKTAAGSPSVDKALYVFAYGTSDPATPKYPDNVTGSDAAITFDDPTQLRLIGVIQIPAGAVEYVSEPMSVAAAFGGVLPAKWGIAIRNYCGLSLSSTEADCGFWYQGVYYTST